MIDCELAKLGTWYSPIMYPVLSPALRSGLLKIYNLADDDIVWRIVFAQKFAAMVRGSPQMQDHMRGKGLRGTLGSLSHGRYRTEGANLMHELRQLSLQSGKGPLYFGNVSCALSELVRAPRSTPAQFRPSTPLDGTGDPGGLRHTNSRIKPTHWPTWRRRSRWKVEIFQAGRTRMRTWRTMRRNVFGRVRYYSALPQVSQHGFTRTVLSDSPPCE